MNICAIAMAYLLRNSGFIKYRHGTTIVIVMFIFISIYEVMNHIIFQFVNYLDLYTTGLTGTNNGKVPKLPIKK